MTKTIADHSLVAINVSSSWDRSQEPGSLHNYRAALGFWPLLAEEAKKREYILAIADGEVVGVYQAEDWVEVDESFELENTRRSMWYGRVVEDDEILQYIGSKVSGTQGGRYIAAGENLYKS